MGKTTIEWTDFSVNPIRARHKQTGAVGHYCEKISDGCKNCYASRLQSRFNMPAFNEQRGDDDIEVFFDESKLQDVLKRKKPTRWFWCDMTDMFGSWVLDEWLDKIFATMALTPQHTHQVLTKRPERMRDYMLRRDWSQAANHITNKFIRPLEQPLYLAGEIVPPLPNVFLGVSVEDQKTADERIPLLLQTPAAVRFISAEPLLGAIDLFKVFGGENSILSCQANCNDDCCGWPACISQELQWVIAGGESGHNARPCHPDWMRSLRDQCQTSGIKFFMKQWGEWLPGSQADHISNGELVGFKALSLDDEDGTVWCFKTGKKRAGRLLDGQEWDETPVS